MTQERSDGVSPPWRPISTAPLDKTVFLWWVGDGEKLLKQKPTITIGQVSSHKNGFVWTGAMDLPMKYYTHWLPLDFIGPPIS